MLETLPLFHRIAGQAVIVIGEGPAADAKRRLVERAGGVPCGEDAGGARLAFVALDEPEAVAARLRARGVLVNVVDRPALCDFTTPALLERGPVLVAVGTGGASAGLAKHIRLRLEALLPESLGGLARGLAAARARLRARFPDAAARRLALDMALAEGGALDPLDSASAGRLDSWLAADDQAAPLADEVVHIALRSADPQDLTLREAALLGRADGVAHSPAVADAILRRARADAQRVVLAEGEDFTGGSGLWVVLLPA